MIQRLELFNREHRTYDALMPWNTRSIEHGVFAAWPESGIPEVPALVATKRDEGLILSWESGYAPREAFERVRPINSVHFLLSRLVRHADAPGVFADARERKLEPTDDPLEIRIGPTRRSVLSLRRDSPSMTGDVGEWIVGNPSNLHPELDALWPYVMQTAASHIRAAPGDARAAAQVILFDARNFVRHHPRFGSQTPPIAFSE